MSRRVLGTLCLALLVLLAGGATAPAAELGLGDPAPKLELARYLKGEPVKGIEKGNVYVVEFWATWCGPCVATIPHLTELQKKHKDVIFLGVNMGETDVVKVTKFVADMGEKMDYRVAMEAMDEGSEEGKMSRNWMNAAGQNGIPAAFIVDKASKIAWIGHPGEMDQPLADIVAGKWNIETAVAKAKEQKKAQAAMMRLQEQFQEAMEKGDHAKIVELLDGVIKQTPAMEARLAVPKYGAMAKLKDVDAAVTYGKHLLENLYKDNQQALNHMAWAVVDTDAEKKSDVKLLAQALAMAKRADELAKTKDPAIADTLALCYFENGDVAKAVEVQKRAVAQAKEKELPGVEELEARLEKFTKALNKAEKKSE